MKKQKKKGKKSKKKHLKVNKKNIKRLVGSLDRTKGLPRDPRTRPDSRSRRRRSAPSRTRMPQLIVNSRAWPGGRCGTWPVRWWGWRPLRWSWIKNNIKTDSWWTEIWIWFLLPPGSKLILLILFWYAKTTFFSFFLWCTWCDFSSPAAPPPRKGPPRAGSASTSTTTTSTSASANQNQMLFREISWILHGILRNFLFNCTTKIRLENTSDFSFLVNNSFCKWFSNFLSFELHIFFLQKNKLLVTYLRIIYILEFFTKKPIELIKYGLKIREIPARKYTDTVGWMDEWLFVPAWRGCSSRTPRPPAAAACASPGIPKIINLSIERQVRGVPCCPHGTRIFTFLRALKA